MSRLGDAFERARRDRRAAFVGYLTAGDPSLEATLSLARALDRAGADVLELGVPFTDPIADGPVLQRAAARALDARVSLSDVFALGRRIRAKTRLALVLFSYLNPILRRGVLRAAAEARAAGFDAVLATDLPPEEGQDFARRFRAAGLDTVFLVSPTSPLERMRSAAALSSGFLYVVSRAGTTGARSTLASDLAATVARARRAAGSLPIAVGFGIATAASAKRVARIADGVVVGSALVSAAETAGADRARAVEKLASSLVAACRR
ncbi:MAG TPA: tryptophan synthase subunit alpha [Thermoanaerobaculia bacterium]|nr:tryptophan synthase subunit alpha [Thermoanaerobaculia bacterium]